MSWEFKFNLIKLLIGNKIFSWFWFLRATQCLPSPLPFSPRFHLRINLEAHLIVRMNWAAQKLCQKAISCQQQNRMGKFWMTHNFMPEMLFQQNDCLGLHQACGNCLELGLLIWKMLDKHVVHPSSGTQALNNPLGKLTYSQTPRDMANSQS